MNKKDIMEEEMLDSPKVFPKRKGSPRRTRNIPKGQVENLTFSLSLVPSKLDL